MSSQIMVNAQETDDSQRYDRLFLEAIIEREKGNDAAAFEMLRHCLDIKPEASEAYYYLAHYYLRMKDNDKALAAFKKASLLEPDNVNYLETLAQMYLQSQDLESATETFERLSKAEPDREDVLGMLVQLYSNDKNQYPKAIATLDRMEQLDGMNERISYAKAEFYQKMGNGKAAIAEMKKLADQYPNDLNYRNAYADMLLVNNNEKKAIDIYRGILKEEPANSKVLFSMRTYFLGQGNTVAADSMTVNILTRSNANTDEKIYLLRQEVMDNENDGGDSTKVIQLFERTINAKGSDPSIGLLHDVGSESLVAAHRGGGNQSFEQCDCPVGICVKVDVHSRIFGAKLHKFARNTKKTLILFCSLPDNLYFCIKFQTYSDENELSSISIGTRAGQAIWRPRGGYLQGFRWLRVEVGDVEPTVRHRQAGVERIAESRCEGSGKHRYILQQLSAISLLRLRCLGSEGCHHPVLCHKQ